MAQADLISAVLELASDDDTLTERVQLLILGALDSDQGLEDALGGQGQTIAEVTAVQQPPTPIGAYLRSVKVAGFRGVGPEVTVRFHPGPGLTIIAGRNGSGKSSIAEALEMALTGSNYRWDHQKTAVWTANWRNLHGKVPAEIRVELAEDGKGITTIGVDWSSDAGLREGTYWVQRQSEKRRPGRETLGWEGPLDLYRPLLSYDEVGGVLEGTPSGLYDKLHSLLGLEPITEGQTRLAAASRRLQAPIAEAKTFHTELKSLLGHSADPRAAQALKLLAKRAPDRAAVQALATGSPGVPGGQLDKLRGLAQISWPAPADVELAADELRSAVGGLAGLASLATQLLASRSRLLTQALEMHRAHGEIDCPVCGVGRLDEDWAFATQAALDVDRSQTAGLRAAQDRLDAARRDARRLVDGVRPLPLIDDAELTEYDAAAQAQAVWSSAPAEDLGLADHLVSAAAPLAESYGPLQDQARQLVAAREDLWAPLALRLGQWVGLASASAESAPLVADVKSAAEWLKARAGDLRNQRLAPLADRARAIWAQLRQESNVDLGAVRLEGQMTSRHVELSAEVDGVAAGALGVMSQGELHALALSLFLPRATAPESPFRFIVLDDPIQAMDPAKVQGFVQVLQELAVDRQVIVLSHDDRLPAAVRRAKVKAAIFEVTRNAGSGVTITESSHPASRYLDDGFALAQDDGVPADVKGRVIPGLCRMALETIAFEVFESGVIAKGGTRQAVEQEWAGASRLRQRLALALHGDKSAVITKWLVTGRHSEAFEVCNRAVHSGSVGDHAEEVRAVRSTIKDLRARL